MQTDGVKIYSDFNEMLKEVRLRRCKSCYYHLLRTNLQLSQLQQMLESMSFVKNRWHELQLKQETCGMPVTKQV